MKQNFRIFAVVAVLLVAIASCSKEDGVGIPEPATPQEVSYRVSVKDALRSANNILSAGDRATRSVERKVKSTELYIAKPATRSNDGVEVSFYLINYEDNAGYALVSTDKRATPVYMFADEGNITTAAFEEVTPLAIFMDEAIANYEIEVASSGTDGPIDIGLPPGIDGRIGILNGVEYYLQENTTYLTKGPYTATRWHQGYPYNIYCDNNLVGCLPLAMGQIMAYYRHPNSLNNRVLNWDNMSQLEFYNINDSGAEDVAYFLRQIGEIGDADYRFANPDENEDGGTYMSMANIEPTYNTFGYLCGDYQTFDVDMAIAQLDQQKPFIAYGVRIVEGESGEDYKEVAHAWIIHGYRIEHHVLRYLYKTPPYLEYTTREYSTIYLRHNVGWQSTNSNLYYDYYTLTTDFIHPLHNGMVLNISPNL